MGYLLLFWEFFKAGLFAIGGGLATLPFLYDMADRYDWFTRADLADMIAISESTPGAIGINCATYAGFTAYGVFGSVLATFGLVLPSLIIIISIAGILDRFNDSKLVKSAFYGLRPVVTALIASACFEILEITIFNLELFEMTGAYSDLFNWVNLVLLCLFVFAVQKFKKHPILYIAIGAVLGIVLQL